MKSTLAALLAVALLSVLPTSGANATILQVNCVTGPFFTINSAVAAASNGDSIVVEDCGTPYAENVVIAGLTGVHMVGASGTDFGARAAGVGAPVAPTVRIVGTATGGACVSIENSTDIKVQNFQLANCQGDGVRINTAQEVLVLANRFVNVQGSGVAAVNGDDINIISNLIVFAQQFGLLIQETDESTLADNFILASTRSGVALAGGVRNRVDNNDIRFSGDEGLTDGTSRVRIERNSFVQNGGAGDILLEASSNGADVIGNSVPGGIVDLGTGTEVLNNF